MPAGNAIAQFLKANAKFAYGGGLLMGGLGAAFTAGDFNKRMKEGDSAFKALIKTAKDFLLIRVALVGTFTAVGAAVRSLVKDTGSLDAAIKRLSEIQRFQRVFTPLVGGAREARRHVAELLNFANSTPFKFESVAEADKNLRGLTRGAFAGTGALRTIGDAAAASGNGIAESAAAVGDFYTALHNGEPINRAVEQLRQMGLVSSLTAQHLDRLAQAGSSSIDMATNLTKALEESRGGMSSYARDLEAVSTAHEKAVESAKAAFGKGFVQPEAEKTKNYTAAIVALTPALEQSGKFLASWFNTLASTGSKIVKFAAETGFLGGAIKTLAAVAVAGGAGLTIFGLAAIPVVGPFLALAAALTFAGVGIYKFSRISKDAARELRELNKTHREAQANIDAHAAAIQDLTDLQEQYGRSVQHIIDLQNELAEAEKKHDAGKIQEITRAIEEARIKMHELPRPEQLASRERGAVIGSRLEERQMRERSRFEESVRERPGEAPQLRKERAELLEQRAADARRGLETRQKIAEAQGGKLEQKADLQLEISGLEKKKEAGNITKEENQRLKQSKNELSVIQSQLLETQAQMGQGTAAGMEAQAQRLHAAQRAVVLEKEAEGITNKKEQKEKLRQAAAERRVAGGVQAGPDTGRQIQDLMATAKELADFETRIPEIAQEARGERGAIRGQTREQAVGNIELAAQTGAAQALVRGDSNQREAYQDIGAFTQSFEQYRQTYGDDVARQMALQERSNQLTEQIPTDIRPVADSLTRIGGGGGVTGPTGDPRQRVQERIRDLTAASLDVLKHIDAAVSGAGTPEAGGGAANPALELPPGAPGTPEATGAPTQLNPAPGEEMTATPVAQLNPAPNEEMIAAPVGAGAVPSAAPTPSSSVVPTTTFEQLAATPTYGNPMPTPTPAMAGIQSVSVAPMPTPMPNPTPSSAYDMVSVLKDIHKSSTEGNDHLKVISTKDQDAF